MLVLHRTSCQVLLVVVLVCVKTVSCVSLSAVAKPSATQAKWLDYEMGAVIHFNMQTFDNFMKSGTYCRSFTKMIHDAIEFIDQIIIKSTGWRSLFEFSRRQTTTKLPHLSVWKLLS